MDKIRKSKRRESLMNPYEVLGVDSNATDDEIKKHTNSSVKNTTLMPI